VTLDALAAAVRPVVSAPVDLARTLDDVVEAVVRAAKPGDVVITLGAGSIGTLPERLLAALGGPS
jgi:UDP-N-acetylmuramate-alanine ligase